MTRSVFRCNHLEVAHLGNDWNDAFQEAEPAQFGIDAAAFAATPSAAFADGERCAIDRADKQQQTAQEPQFQRAWLC